jgi:hypothetical protein
VSELALNDDQRHALESDLDRVRVPQLMRRLAPTPARAAPDQQRAAAVIEIALGQSESLLDTEPASPHDHDQTARCRPCRSCVERARLSAPGRAARTAALSLLKPSSGHGESSRTAAHASKQQRDRV